MKYGGGAPDSPLSMGPERPRYATVVRVYLVIYLFVLIYKLGETIQCAALFSHGTQWPSCSLENAGLASLSPRPAWGGIPKEKT